MVGLSIEIVRLGEIEKTPETVSVTKSDEEFMGRMGKSTKVQDIL